MPIIDFEKHSPVIGKENFLAPDAWIIGKCKIGDNVSIFFGSVLRGDIEKIIVGNGTNIQEHAMLHTSHGLGDCVIGEDVTIGHRAIIHGCKIGNRCIIGMGSVILDGATIGDDCIIGAQALVPMNMRVPSRSMVLGVPAKVVRELKEEEIENIKKSALNYQKLGKIYSSIDYQLPGCKNAPKH